MELQRGECGTESPGHVHGDPRVQLSIQGTRGRRHPPGRIRETSLKLTGRELCPPCSQAGASPGSQGAG